MAPAERNSVNPAAGRYWHKKSQIFLIKPGEFAQLDNIQTALAGLYFGYMGLCRSQALCGLNLIQAALHAGVFQPGYKLPVLFGVYGFFHVVEFAPSI